MKKWPKTYALLKSTAFIIIFVIFLVGSSQLVLLIKEPLPKLYYGIFGTLGALLTLLIFLKSEGKKEEAIRLNVNKKTTLNFLNGIVVGIGIFMLMMLILIAFGGMYFQKITPIHYGNIALSLIPFIPLALMEEIAFRTYPFLRLKSKLGVWYAQFSMAMLFALYHILMGWPVHIAFLGPFIWSFVFGLSALWSKGIAMPFGLHLALNLMQNLAGMKNETSAIFKLTYRNNPSKELEATNEYLGISMHIVILAIACFLTYEYIRKNRSSAS